MCSICGCGIDAGDAEMFSKDYECLDGRHIFKNLGIIRTCPSCKSRNVKRIKWWLSIENGRKLTISMSLGKRKSCGFLRDFATMLEHKESTLFWIRPFLPWACTGSQHHGRRTNSEQLSEDPILQANNRWPTSAGSLLSPSNSRPTKQCSLLDKWSNEVETASPGLKPMLLWRASCIHLVFRPNYHLPIY